MFILSEAATLSKLFCFLPVKESTLKGTNLLPFRVDPFQKGLVCGKEEGLGVPKGGHGVTCPIKIIGSCFRIRWAQVTL